MLKKKLHTALSLIICCFTATGIHAQTNVSVTLTEANITSKAEVLLPTYTVGTYSVILLDLAVNIGVKSTTGNFPAATAGTFSPLDLTVVRVKSNSLGILNLGASSTEIILTNGVQSIYSSVNLLGGAFKVDYKIITSGYPWLAGKYATPIEYSPSRNLSPTIQNLEIVVPGFITLNSATTTSSAMHITSLAQFRNAAGISTNSNIDYYASVPTLVNLKSTNSSFAITPLVPVTPLVTPVSTLLQTTIANPAGPVISVTNTDNLLTSSTGIPVIADNRRTISATYNISKTNLYSSFACAGTYSLPMVYTISKPVSAYPVTLASKTVNNTLQLIVDNLTEITLPVSTVSLDFNNQNDFKSGVSSNVLNQINLSSTVPYNITVKASSSNFATSDGSSTIPVSVVTIEGMTGQNGITPITLSTTAQPIITAGAPEIDKILNLKYSIPASKIPADVLGRSQGTYTTNIIYTMVSP